MHEKMYTTGTVNHVVQNCNMCNSLALGKGLEPGIKKSNKQEEKEMEDIKLINAMKGLELKIKCIRKEAMECFSGIIQAKDCIENAIESLIRRYRESGTAAEETGVALELLCTCLEYVEEDIADAENSRGVTEGYSSNDMLADDDTMENAMFEYERYMMLLESGGSKLYRIIEDMGIICHTWGLPVEYQEAAQKYIIEANNSWNSVYRRYEELDSVYCQYDELHDKEVYLNFADDGNKTEEVCGYWEWGNECEYEFMIDWMQCRELLVQQDKEMDSSDV